MSQVHSQLSYVYPHPFPAAALKRWRDSWEVMQDYTCGSQRWKGQVCLEVAKVLCCGTYIIDPLFLICVPQH